MGKYGVNFKKIQDILEWYEDQEWVKYAIYHDYKINDKAVHAVFSGSDKEDGLQNLAKILERIKSSDSDKNTYYIKLLPSKANSKELTSGASFCLFEESSINKNLDYFHPNNEIISRLASIEQKLLDEDLEEEEDVIEENPNSILAGIMQNPQVQSILINMITSIAGTFTKAPKATQMAGIDEDPDIYKSVELLLSKGVTAEDIAKLASMDANKLSFLLNMLRNG